MLTTIAALSKSHSPAATPTDFTNAEVDTSRMATNTNDDGTRTVEVGVDAEFITQLGDELRKRDESVEEFFAESCRERLDNPIEK